MTRFSFLAVSVLATACLLAGRDAQAAGIPKAVSAAVDDAARPQADKDRDAVRKPAETIAFAGVKPGDKVVELMPAAGYYTRILSALVGPKGHVYAVSPPPMGERDFGKATKALAADPHYSNVTAVSAPFTAVSVPEPVDIVWTSRNYHDFHNGPNADIATFDKAMFNLLKPGGTFLVLDHAAEPGSGTRDTATLHRIDPAAVKTEATAAGFKLDKEGNFLHNPDDPHTGKVFEMHDKSDQFVLKFTRPK
jgi:predicted methyltransferase